METMTKRVAPSAYDTHQAVKRVIKSGGTIRQVYESNNCQPPFSEMQGWKGLDTAAHVAREVIKVSLRGSSVTADAAHFLNTYVPKDTFTQSPGYICEGD